MGRPHARALGGAIRAGGGLCGVQLSAGSGWAVKIAVATIGRMNR